jgi:hypothetical protein
VAAARLSTRCNVLLQLSGRSLMLLFGTPSLGGSWLKISGLPQ